jgi:hypothetical protein
VASLFLRELVAAAEAEESDPCLNDEDPADVDFVSGYALCIKREVVTEIGLVDPRFCFYYEETVWCVRAHTAGLRVMIVPRSRIWHKVSAAIGSDSPATTYYLSRNVFLFLRKNLHGFKRLRALAMTWLGEMRTVAAHSLRPRYRRLRRNRDARMLALRDALLGCWGKMGADVASLCDRIDR